MNKPQHPFQNTLDKLNNPWGKVLLGWKIVLAVAIYAVLLALTIMGQSILLGMLTITVTFIVLMLGLIEIGNYLKYRVDLWQYENPLKEEQP